MLKIRVTLFFFIITLFSYGMVFLSGCEINDDNTERWDVKLETQRIVSFGEALVSPAYGGKVSALNSMASIDITPGLLSDPTMIYVNCLSSETEKINLLDQRFYCGGIDLGPTGKILNGNAKITIPLEKAMAPERVIEIFRLEDMSGNPLSFNTFSEGVEAVWSETGIKGIVDKSGYTVSAEISRLYTYAAADYDGIDKNFMISMISPETASRGSIVNIYGSGFGSARQDSMVFFGENAVNVFHGWSNSLIQAVVPDTAVSSRIKVEKSGIYSNEKYIIISDAVNPPRIDNIFPSSGSFGRTVRIRGARFGIIKGSSEVFISGVKALNYPLWSDDEIFFRVPEQASTGKIIVRVLGIDSNSENFVVSKESMPEPLITGASPEAAAINQRIVISGGGFGLSQGTSLLSVEGVSVPLSSILEWTEKSIEFLVPPGAVSGNICLSVNNRTSNGMPCRIIQPEPVITRLFPEYANHGDQITIEGSGFGFLQADSQVKINNTEVNDFIIWSETRVVFNVPDECVSGNVSITVLGRLSNTMVLGINEPGQWNVSDIPVLKDIRDIMKDPQGIIWACGGDSGGTGFIMSKSGSVWNILSDTLETRVNTLAFKNSSDFWAAGGNYYNSFIAHYQSGVWNSVNLSDNMEINDIDFVPGKEELWACGMDGILLNYDTVQWNSIDLSVSENLYTLEFVTPSEAWAGGGDSSGGSGIILHYLSSAWSRVKLPVDNAVYKLWFNSQNSGWAFCSGGVILYYNGSDWVRRNSPGIFNLYDAHFIDPTSGWACGERGSVIEYVNGEWKIDNKIPSSRTRFSIFFDNISLGWSGGEGGNMIEYTE
jgi:hypothetical protein